MSRPLRIDYAGTWYHGMSREAGGIYTQRFNRIHKYDGQLFRGRYKSILVEVDSYLLELLRYIHKNPLRAGFSNDLNDYE